MKWLKFKCLKVYFNHVIRLLQETLKSANYKVKA